MTEIKLDRYRSRDKVLAKEAKPLDEYDELVYLKALIGHLEWSLLGARKLLEEKEKKVFPEPDTEFDQLQADRDKEYYGRYK